LARAADISVPQRYGAVAIVLHWALAAALAWLFWRGWTMVDMDLSPDKFTAYATHKSLGLTVFAAALFRLAWRWTHPVPPLPADTPRWQHLVAHTTHYSLYGLLLLIPLSGWVLNSTTGFPLSWFGWFGLPPLTAADQAAIPLAASVHSWLGWALLALVALHVAGALQHALILRDGLLYRMLPLSLALTLTRQER
jgi:cytochrome b561